MFDIFNTSGACNSTLATTKDQKQKLKVQT